MAAQRKRRRRLLWGMPVSAQEDEPTEGRRLSGWLKERGHAVRRNRAQLRALKP